MANKLYLQSETTKTWKVSGGDKTISLVSGGVGLANNAGRVGEVMDLGAYPRASDYFVYMETKVQSGTTVGNLIELWFSFWSDEAGSAGEDADVGTTDAALGAANDRYQLHFFRAIPIRSTSTSAIQTCSGMLFVPTRYISPVVYNASGAALSTTTGDHVIKITPKPLEIQ